MRGPPLLFSEGGLWKLAHLNCKYEKLCPLLVFPFSSSCNNFSIARDQLAKSPDGFV